MFLFISTLHTKQLTFYFDLNGNISLVTKITNCLFLLEIKYIVNFSEELPSNLGLKLVSWEYASVYHTFHSNMSTVLILLICTVQLIDHVLRLLGRIVVFIYHTGLWLAESYKVDYIAEYLHQSWLSRPVEIGECEVFDAAFQ